MTNETKKRVARILDDSVEGSARKQQEKADELEAKARYNIGVMLGVCAAFVLAFASFIRSTHPRDAAVIFLISMAMLIIAGWYVDRGNGLLRRLAKKLRRLWGNPT